MSGEGGRALERLGELVSIETPSGDARRLDQAYELVGKWGFEAIGREPERVEVEGVPHLLWRATGDQRVLVLCHADTVFPAGTIDRRPFRVDGERAFGPGVFDMKAGIVVALEAIEAVGKADGIALLVTGDEETGSVTSRALIESLAVQGDAVLVLEPSLDGALKVGRKGGSFYRLHFHGRAAHAGLEPELGSNALLEMAHWATEVVALADPAAGTTVTPTLARAGTAMNVVPDSGELSVDVRARTMAELDRVENAVRALAEHRAELPDGVSVVIEGGLNRPPLEEDGSVSLVELCQAEARRAGLPEPGTAAVGGGSDGNFTAALGVPTLDGLGPAGGGAHAEHEWVEIASIDERARIVAGMLRSLCADRR